MRRQFRLAARVCLLGLLAAGVVALYAYGEARRLPAIRWATLALADWPAGIAPVRVVLISDIHLGNQTMDATRLRKVVDEINVLSPDIVLIAGDFIAGHAEDRAGRDAARLIAPLRRLRVRIGIVAVLGNHDHWSNATAVTRALERAGITVLNNNAARIGPLVVGGLDDDFTERARPAMMLARMARLVGPRLVLSHSPDPAARMPTPLVMLAGHTHCGQVVLPIVGRLVSVSRLGNRYACGLIREPGRTVIVTAGLGTSQLPFRLGAVPDLWLLTIGPGGPGQRPNRSPARPR
ncbi:metallophosphoesterase [Sphingomonas sp. 28-63-12]|uniref:metallophosphoesterase n=1 Tax=Sphingomonas sp. 28-63-12 TaxID=1970434 RepID=UPI000BD021F9|nr:MAG: hypothetical protein B7Y47_10535 [Sphingomonas sp. 28-63-12]